MKVKSAVIGALLLLMSFALGACGSADDGKITTENAETTAISTTNKPSMTNEGMLEEMSSIANDISEGASETASELKSDTARMFR